LTGGRPYETVICQRQVKKLYDLSTSGDKAVTVIDEANKLVQCFLVLGSWKRANRLNRGNVGSDTSCTDGVTQEVHF